MEIISKSIESINPYESNPRNNERAVEKVVSSIKEFGFKVPIIIEKNGTIVAGHTRYLAAKQLELKEVPCIIADDLTPAQIKAFRIADNKTAEYSEWDFDLLTQELEELKELDFNLDLTALDEFEQERLLNPITDTDIDSFFEATEYEANRTESNSASDSNARETKKVQCPHCKEWFDIA